MTKEMRNAIYKIALEVLTRRICKGLCFALEIGVNVIINDGTIFDNYYDRNIPDEYSPYCSRNSNTENVYPEIFRYKPDDESSFWFPTTNRQIRMNILRKAIKETNP